MFIFNILLTDFLNKSVSDIDGLENLLATVKVSVKNLALHYCEDPEKFCVEECFKIFADFFDKITQAKIVRNFIVIICHNDNSIFNLSKN